MNKPQKTKLCWNCEGSVSRTVENCPYCGVYLSPEAADIKEEKGITSKAHYTPSPPKKGEIPKAPYAPQEAEPVQAITEATLIPSKTGILQTVFLPILLLSAGAIGVFFALVLFLFASRGTLTLQWNAESWYLYLLGSAPLLALGWYTLTRSE